MVFFKSFFLSFKNFIVVLLQLSCLFPHCSPQPHHLPFPQSFLTHCLCPWVLYSCSFACAFPFFPLYFPSPFPLVSISLFFINSFLKNYLFMFFRERGREGEREGEKHQCARETSISCLLHVFNCETWRAAQVCALTGTCTSDLLVCWMVPNPLHNSVQGYFLNIWRAFIQWNSFLCGSISLFHLCCPLTCSFLITFFHTPLWAVQVLHLNCTCYWHSTKRNFCTSYISERFLLCIFAS